MNITNKTFKRTLAEMIKADGKQSERIQGVTEYAFGQAEQGQLTPLTDVYNAVIKLRGVNTNLFKDYVKAHVSNITLTQKGDRPSYKKAKKGEAIQVKSVEVLFVDFEREKKAPQGTPKKDFGKLSVTLMDSLDQLALGGVESKKKLTDEQVKKARDLARQLAELLA